MFSQILWGLIFHQFCTLSRIVGSFFNEEKEKDKIPCIYGACKFLQEMWGQRYGVQLDTILNIEEVQQKNSISILCWNIASLGWNLEFPVLMEALPEAGHDFWLRCTASDLKIWGKVQRGQQHIYHWLHQNYCSKCISQLPCKKNLTNTAGLI